MKSFEFEKVSIVDARREIEGEPKQAYEGSRRYPRAYQETDDLLNTTLTWMAGLPKDVRPMMLGRLFPRIANRIADLWRRVAHCEDYLDTLIVDGRGNRAGFPPDVAQELTNLRGFYAQLHPDHGSSWDQVGAGN
jgi:hypothetical protein